MDTFVDLIAKVGFPIAAALAAGSFVFLTLKFILAGVTSAVSSMSATISALNDRVDIMNNELNKTDIKVTAALGLDIDYSKIARSTQTDQRKD